MTASNGKLVSITSRRDTHPLTSERNYVMTGSSAMRALDTYHLILAPTHACNLRCKHCYLPDHSNQLLPREIALRLVDEWSEITLAERGRFGGIFHVKGGEPFVVPYLEDLMDRMIQHQTLRLMLTTNGTFTSKRVIDRLESCNLGLHGHMTIIVSLDGASSRTHDSLRGDGQFNITHNFLLTLQELGLNTHLNCVLHKHNLDELRAYIELALRLDVTQINFLPLVPKGYGSSLRETQASHLDIHQELQSLYDSSDERTRALLAGSLSHITDLHRNEGIAAAHECVAAYRGLFYITPEGDAYTCPNLLGKSHSIGNVHTSSLHALCERLPHLYTKLRGKVGNDQYICTGERVLYESTNDSTNLQNLFALQRFLSNSPSSQTSKVPGTAYCVSRNF